MQTLQHIILEAARPALLLQCRHDIPLLLATMQLQQMSITAELRKIAAGAQQETVTAQAVQHCQFQMIFLLEVIQHYRQQCDAVLLPTYTEMEACLQQVLAALEQDFARYMSVDYLLPTSYGHIVSEQLQVRMVHLQTQLRQRGISEPLLEQILLPLAGSQEVRTFRLVMYFRQLFQQLGAGTEHPQRNLDETVHRILFAHNFNSADYFLYCTQVLRRKLDECVSLRAALRWMQWLQREMQLFTVKTVVLSPGSQPLKTRLEHWLEKEQGYITSLRKMEKMKGLLNKV